MNDALDTDAPAPAPLGVKIVLFLGACALALPVVLIALVGAVEVVLGERVNMPRRGFLDTLPEAEREGMWTEFLEATQGDRQRYRSNAHWIGGAYAGTYYNVDEAGVRRTVQATKKGPKVFMFGGSSLWGFHAKDAETIPSLVSSELAKLGVDAEVVNHGQIGYISVQEAIYLSQLVAEDDIPAVAVFLDGLNDVDSPKLLSSVGWHTPAEVTGIHFADADYYGERQNRRTAWTSLKASLRKFRAIEPLGAFGILPEPPPPGAGGWTETDEARMYELIAHGYASSVAMAEGLGRGHGFDTLFYWQPTVSRKKTLTDHESPPRFIGARDGTHFTKVTEHVVRRLAGKPHFKDISGLLDDLTETGYTDSRHYTVLGKRMIAARIAQDLAPRLRPEPEPEPEPAPTEAPVAPE